MSNVLIIGARREVVTQKYISWSHVFSGTRHARKNKAKSDILAKESGALRVQSAQLDADSVPRLVELMRVHLPDLVIHIELPYQDRCRE